MTYFILFHVSSAPSQSTSSHLGLRWRPRRYCCEGPKTIKVLLGLGTRFSERQAAHTQGDRAASLAEGTTCPAQAHGEI